MFVDFSLDLAGYTAVFLGLLTSTKRLEMVKDGWIRTKDIHSPSTSCLCPISCRWTCLLQVERLCICGASYIQHIANLAIRLLSCAPNLKHCRILLGFEKFLEFHCIFCTSCKDVHSRYFQTMSFVAIFPSNWAVTCPPLLCRNRIFFSFSNLMFVNQ